MDEDRKKAQEEFKELASQMGSIEVDEQRTKDSPLANVPRLFKQKLWIIWLTIGTIISL